MHRQALPGFAPLCALLLSSACGSSAPQPLTPPSVPGARCTVAASQERPLIVEWDAASRNDLDALLKQDGVVVARYSGCEMELLRDCRAPGAYKYIGATRQDESIYMRDADELWANLPLGAASLEGSVQSGGQLRLDMSVIGKYVGDNPILELTRFRGQGCQGATHVVVGLTTGAFEMVSGSQSTISASAVVAGGSSSAGTETLRRAGDRNACEAATRADTAPPEGCGALLRLELAPVQCPGGAHLEPGEGCVGAQGEAVAASLGGPGGANDSRDDAFGRLVLDAAHVVLARMQGKPVPAGMTMEFEQPFDEFRKPFLTLGPTAQMLLAEGEVALDRTDAANPARLTVYAHLQVHGDGQVRWGELSAFVENDGGKAGMPLAQVPPAMTGLHEHLVHALTQENCLPTPAMRVEDWAYLRNSISQFMDNGDLLTPEDAQKTCAQVSAFTGPWEVQEPELFVAFGTDKQYITVKLQFVPKPDNTFHIRASLRDTSVSERE